MLNELLKIFENSPLIVSLLSPWKMGMRYYGCCRWASDFITKSESESEQFARLKVIEKSRRGMHRHPFLVGREHMVTRLNHRNCWYSA